jgi:hypothetical protein
VAGDRDLSGRQECRGGRRLLDHERVVEIEQQRALHGLILAKVASR